MPNSRGTALANEATITEKGIADLNAKIELVKDEIRSSAKSSRTSVARGRKSFCALESKPDDCDRYR